MNDEELPIVEHLAALRKCIIQAGIGMVVGISLCYAYSEDILAFLAKPLFDVLPPDQQKLYFTSPMEKLLIFIKIGVAGGIALASPWIMYQGWKFVVPALYKKERRFVIPLLIAGTSLFFGGCALSYFFMVPTGLKYLMMMGGSTDGAIITYTAYIDVLLMMTMLTGAVFQVPLLIFLAVSTGLVHISKLRKMRATYYVAMAVLAGAATPSPDPFSMLAMWIPSVILFEITLMLLVWKK